LSIDSSACGLLGLLLFIGGLAAARIVTEAYDEKPTSTIVVESRMMFQTTLPLRWVYHAAQPQPRISASAKSTMPELTGRPSVLTKKRSTSAPT